MIYNKLVRDKILEIIHQDNKIPIAHYASEEEYWEKLKEKLVEEVHEFLVESNEEEFVDILEVIHAISDFRQFNKEFINQLRKEKADKRGSFKDKIILERVE